MITALKKKVENVEKSYRVQATVVGRIDFGIIKAKDEGKISQQIMIETAKLRLSAVGIENISLVVTGVNTEEVIKWRRYRFHTRSVDDYRPLIFNPAYPWWCSGEGWDSQRLVKGELVLENEYVTIIAYLPENEDLKAYWDDAYDVDFKEYDELIFTDRFPKPEYYKE
jgi:hypothetical protein